MAVGRAFLAVPIEGWPETVELLQASGRPWPEWAVVADLRWHVDQVGDLPGRPTLASRWGWTGWAVRQLLADVEAWWDPTKGAAPRSRAELRQRAASGPPARRQRTASGPPARRQPDDGPTPTTEPDPPARRQSAASAPPADRQRTATRALDPPSPSPSPSPDLSAADARAREPVAPEPGPPRPPSEDLELQVAELMALQEDDEPQHGMRPPRDVAAVRRALMRGTPPERLRALWAWSGVSDHPAIAGCRDGDWRRWGALLKQPRGEERLALAWAWHEAGRPTDAPARASPARPRRQSALEMLESIRASRDADGPQVIDAAAWFSGGVDG